MGEDCCKGHDHKDCCNDKEDDGMSMSDIVYNNDILLNTVIEMLIEKKVITEKDLLEKLNEVEEDFDEESDDE